MDKKFNQEIHLALKVFKALQKDFDGFFAMRPR